MHNKIKKDHTYNYTNSTTTSCVCIHRKSKTRRGMKTSVDVVCGEVILQVSVTKKVQGR
jgi:hypothetical protein